MPNWVSNELSIAASYDEFRAFMARDTSGPDASLLVEYFNLHRLFPERFGPEDLCGFEAWDYDWMVDHTGTKWNPKIDHVSSCIEYIVVTFDSAWSPPKLLLERLHQITGWKLQNVFEEEAGDFEGTFACENGVCVTTMRPSSPRCSLCCRRFPIEELDEETGECPTCQRFMGGAL